MTDKPRRSPPWQKRLARLGEGARNALDIMRNGRLGAPYRAPFTVVHQERTFSLRHYEMAEGVTDAPALLLVPPLMVTSEIYDISPELSAVSHLAADGLDVWLIDFGAPEHIEGGLDRTLDDHVRAVADAITRVAHETGRAVHVLGYSQGGMFVYQAAAYLRSLHIASVVTFGSPVDIHRNLPAIDEQVAERVIEAARDLLAAPLEQVRGLPGVLTSTGFKLLSARKEVQQIAQFVANLPDRAALMQSESRRRFLGGEGFVAWPGPALRKFIDEFVVSNRLTSGGFVIDGRTVTLADIDCPILYFYGTRDELARPAAVRAIERVVPHAETHSVQLRAGHFGLVVGSTSLRSTWPTVCEWVRWREDMGPVPAMLSPSPSGASEAADDVPDEALDDVDFSIQLFYDVATNAVDAVWNRLGDASRDVAEVVDHLRWQLPRLARLRELQPDTQVSVGRALAEQADAIGDRTFFLWRGRAFSYGDADQRVDNVVRGLLHCGVEPRHRVAVLMRRRPSYLTSVAAVSRLGAVAVLLRPEDPRLALKDALSIAGVDRVLADPESAEEARAAFDGPVLVLGGGGQRRTLIEGVVDMEAIDPDAVDVPEWYEPNPGRAADLAMILFTSGSTGRPRPVRVTNRRWAMAALGTAAAATLTEKDTVYCCLPLHLPTGMLLCVSGALVGGARLALATRFATDLFWGDVSRYGATVVFHSGEMCRLLVNDPGAEREQYNPVRLFVGSGLRAHVWERVEALFHPDRIIEFYASTEGNAVFANVDGLSPGSIGRPLPQSGETAVARWDVGRRCFVHLDDGFVARCGGDEVGMLLSRVDDEHPLAGMAIAPSDVQSDVFESGDRWFATGDLVSRDLSGDHWLHGRAGDAVPGADGLVSLTSIADAAYGIAGVHLAAPWAARVDDVRVPAVALQLEEGWGNDAETWAAAFADLAEGPALVRRVERIELTETFRCVVSDLREMPLDGSVPDLWWNDPKRGWVAVNRRNASRVRRELAARYGG